METSWRSAGPSTTSLFNSGCIFPRLPLTAVRDVVSTGNDGVGDFLDEGGSNRRDDRHPWSDDLVEEERRAAGGFPVA